MLQRMTDVRTTQETCDASNWFGNSATNNEQRCWLGDAWKAVASLLISLRAGILAEDKMEHKRLYAPSDADIESVRAELPEILFDIPAEL